MDGAGWCSVVALAVATAACSGSNKGSNNDAATGCTRVTSADQLCLGQPCDLTWADAQADQSFCSFGNGNGCDVFSCGQFQSVSCFGVDYGDRAA